MVGARGGRVSSVGQGMGRGGTPLHPRCAGCCSLAPTPTLRAALLVGPRVVAVDPPKAGVVVRVLGIARAIVAAKVRELRRSAPLLGRRPCEARLGTAAGLGLGGRKLGAGGRGWCHTPSPNPTPDPTLALTQAQAGAPEVPRVVVAAAAAAPPRATAAAPIAPAACPRAAAVASPRDAARRLDDGAQQPDRAGVRLRLGFG